MSETSAAGAVHMREVGESGPWVVFLHGLFGQGRNFTQIARALEPDLRSLLVDLPDHGRSEWTDGVDYARIADTVADAVRERLGDDASGGSGRRVHLVGHSMGGKVAMVLALRHPDLVERLVVVDISPSVSDGAGEFEHLLDSLRGLDLAGLTSRGDADAQLTAPIGSPTVRGFLLQNLRARDGGWGWQANLEVLRRDLPVIGGFPEIDAHFDRPVLWIAGERSDYVRPEHDETMRRLFPRTRQVTIKGAGHWVHSEQPASFVSALRVFLLADG